MHICHGYSATSYLLVLKWFVLERLICKFVTHLPVLPSPIVARRVAGIFQELVTRLREGREAGYNYSWAMVPELCKCQTARLPKGHQCVCALESLELGVSNMFLSNSHSCRLPQRWETIQDFANIARSAVDGLPWGGFVIFWLQIICMI